MAPLVQELSSLEVEPLEIILDARREGFYTPPGFYTVRSQDSSLDTLTPLGDVEVAALLTGKGVFPIKDESSCCCCFCPYCCC
jgi:hypothetical protein